MARARAATAGFPLAGVAARLLAAFLTLAVLAAASPLARVAAAPVVAIPVGEEGGGADVETVSSACPRRSVGIPGPPAIPTAAAADFVSPAARPRSVSGPPAAPVARGPLRPHPRC